MLCELELCQVTVCRSQSRMIAQATHFSWAELLKARAAWIANHRAQVRLHARLGQCCMRGHARQQGLSQAQRPSTLCALA